MLRDEFGIAPEMSDRRGIVCILTVADTRASLGALVDALRTIAARGPPGSNRLPSCRSFGGRSYRDQEKWPCHPETRFSLVPTPCRYRRPSAASPPSRSFRIRRVSRSWSPGTHRLVKLMYLAQVVARGATCAGAADPRLLTIRVVDEHEA